MTNLEVSVVPTQADREAAADLRATTPWSREQYLTGKMDKKPAVQAFARHRLAHQTPPATQPSATVGEVQRAFRAGFDAGHEAAADNMRGYGATADEAWSAFTTLHTPPPVATATVDAVTAAITETDADFSYSYRLTGLNDGVEEHTLFMQGFEPATFADRQDGYAVIAERRNRLRAEAVLTALAATPTPPAGDK